MGTMSWISALHADPMPWLLEPDNTNPGVRYFALRDLLDAPADDPDVLSARQALMESGPVPAALAAQAKEGYWLEPGPMYGKKYRATHWTVVFLAMLGADGRDPRVARAAEYVLAHYPSSYGGFSTDGRPSGMIHCMQGNLCAALLDLGWAGDLRLQKAVEWLARSITGDGIASADEKDAPQHYYRSGNSGPNFGCAVNGQLPCSWGAVKAALALSKVPAAQRTPLIQQAIQMAVSFLLSGGPLEANYPAYAGGKPNRSWFQFGVPLGYVCDVLQNLEALTALGCGDDPRVRAAVDYVLSKQDEQGRWKMEYTYNGKTWADIEEKGQPSKWVTLRALRVAKRVWEAKAA